MYVRYCVASWQLKCIVWALIILEEVVNILSQYGLQFSLLRGGEVMAWDSHNCAMIENKSVRCP